MVEPTPDQHRARTLRPLLTPESSAVTALVLAVLSLRGQGAWTSALQAFLPRGFAIGEYGTYVVVAGTGSLALAAAAWWLARHAGTSEVPVPAWADHLARAATVIAIVAAVVAVLTIIGGARGVHPM